MGDLRYSPGRNHRLFLLFEDLSLRHRDLCQHRYSLRNGRRALTRLFHRGRVPPILLRCRRRARLSRGRRSLHLRYDVLHLLSTGGSHLVVGSRGQRRRCRQMPLGVLKKLLLDVLHFEFWLDALRWELSNYLAPLYLSLSPSSSYFSSFLSTRRRSLQENIRTGELSSSALIWCGRPCEGVYGCHGA